MRRSLLVLVTSVFLFAGFIVVYFLNHKNVGGLGADDTIAGDEDYFADNVALLKYTKEGLLYYQMQGAHITHNATNDTAFVTTPMMRLYAANNIQWHIKANDGKLYNHNQAVDLINDVVISKFEQNKTTPALQLTTNNIVLHPDSNTFTTGSDVAIDTDSTHTTATGMKANLNNNHIELLNNVKSYYGGK